MVAWVTGSGGLIGNCIVRIAGRCVPDRNVIGLNRGSLDLTDFNAVERKFREDQPQWIIHCAALSKSPACQADPPLARRLNIEVTQRLSELAGNIPFLFFSSDLVFDGQQGNYDESAAPNPLSVYAETKVEAERIVLSNPRHTVIRTSLNGGASPTGDRGFNEELRNAWREGKTLHHDPGCSGMMRT